MNDFKKKLDDFQQIQQVNEAERESDLVNLRIIQRNLVYVSGIPEKYANENLLQTKPFFGKYGEIKKIILNKKSKLTDMMFYCAYITYSEEFEARLCIEDLDESIIEDLEDMEDGEDKSIIKDKSIIEKSIVEDKSIIKDKSILYRDRSIVEDKSIIKDKNILYRDRSIVEDKSIIDKSVIYGDRSIRKSIRCTIRCTYGTTKYCSFFLRNVSCQNIECMYLHTFKEEEDILSKERLGYLKNKLHKFEPKNKLNEVLGKDKRFIILDKLLQFRRDNDFKPPEKITFQPIFYDSWKY